MVKLTELEKMKYWIDSEFCVLHIMFAIIMLNLTHEWYWTLLFTIYIFIQLAYMLIRLAYIAQDDPKYLRVPK